jgi:hypothetical protein
MQPLLAARAKAGIGRAADRAVETASQLMSSSESRSVSPTSSSSLTLREGAPVVACAPGPVGSSPTVPPSGGKPHDIAELVREEIVRALRNS